MCYPRYFRISKLPGSYRLVMLFVSMIVLYPAICLPFSLNFLSAMYRSPAVQLPTLNQISEISKKLGYNVNTEDLEEYRGNS